MRPLTIGVDVSPQGALAASLDTGVAGFHENGEVRLQQVRTFDGEFAQAVVRVVDLLAFVEDVGDVTTGGGEFVRAPQPDRDAAFHVVGAEAIDPAVSHVMRQVVRGWHGVEVASDHHPLIAAEVCTGHHGVAESQHLKVLTRDKRRLDGIGDPLFLMGLTGDIDQRCGHGDDVLGQIEHCSRVVGSRGGPDLAG